MAATPKGIVVTIRADTSGLRRAIDRSKVACLKLLLAVAEQERDDAKADAYALRENRDALELELRAARIHLNETETLLRAARHVGLDLERENGELRERIAELAPAPKRVPLSTLDRDGRRIFEGYRVGLPGFRELGTVRKILCGGAILLVETDSGYTVRVGAASVILDSRTVRP